MYLIFLVAPSGDDTYCVAVVLVGGVLMMGRKSVSWGINVSNSSRRHPLCSCLDRKNRSDV